MSNRDQLAPGIDAFAAGIAAAYARHPDFAALPVAEQRRVAELVRAPWREGGPAMAEVREMTIGASGVRIRVYAPGGAAPRPALMYLHGGGWTFFSLDTHDRVMREYAARAGAIVVGVDYALSPEAKFPTALDQAVEAVDWLRRRGEEIGVAPAQIALGGDSAGANLALSTALRLRDRGHQGIVRGLLLNYGAFDPANSEEAERRYGGFMLNSAEMEVFWSNYLPDPAFTANPLACPLKADLAGLPPVFLTIPELDILAEQSLHLAKRLRAAGVPVEAKVYTGATHSFLEAVSVAEVAAQALEDGAAWLASITDL